MTDKIPSQRKINAMAGTGSGYQTARHEVWSTIREAQEDGIGDLTDAIEWAEILDRSVPAQQGAQLEISHFRSEALRAVALAEVADRAASRRDQDEMLVASCVAAVEAGADKTAVARAAEVSRPTLYAWLGTSA